MGGATSRFDETDWVQGNGQLESLADTIDGCPPTDKYDVYELIKRGVNQREFDIVDSQKNLLYTTRSVPGTLAWFDVLGPGSVGQYQDYRLRVQVDLSRRTWIVYRYSKPLFPSQKPALQCTPQARNGRISPLGGVGSDDDTSLLERYDLYKTVHITVSWSRYIAIAARYGPPQANDNTDQLAIQGSNVDDGADKPVQKGPQFLEDDGGVNRTADEDDLLQKASQMAARWQDCSEEVQHDTKPRQLQEAISMPTLADMDDCDEEGHTSAQTPNSEDPPLSPEKDSHSNTTASLLVSAASSLCKTNCISLADPPASPKATEHDPQTIVESASPQPSNEPFVDDIASTSNGQSNSPEETTPTRGTRVTQYLTSTSRSWSQLFGSTSNGSSLGMDGSDCVDKQDIASPSNKELLRAKRRQQHELELEGVIQLDEAPILQCQEIYNKIIGNHQTSIVTKQDVITLLQLDRKEHEAEIAESEKQQSIGEEGYSPHAAMHGVDDDDDNDSLVAAAVKEERDSVANFGASTETAAQRISGWARKFGFSQSFSSNDSAEPEFQQSGSGPHEELETNASLGNSTPAAYSGGSDPTSWYSKPDRTMELSPLIGYWAWKNTIRTHKIQMHLAKNSDLALHVVLAIIVNQVRIERNAIAMSL